MSKHSEFRAGCIAALTIFFVLSMIPAPALAANIFEPPNIRARDAGFDYNGTLITEACPDCWGTTKYCADENFTKTWTEVQVLKPVSAEGIGEWFEITNFTAESRYFCSEGCSVTLQDCRPTLLWQFIIVVAYILALGLVAYFAPTFGPLGLVAGAVAFVMTLFLALFDVFTWPMSLVIQVMPLVFILFLTFHWYLSKDDQTGEVED